MYHLFANMNEVYMYYCKVLQQDFVESLNGVKEPMPFRVASW